MTLPTSAVADHLLASVDGKVVVFEDTDEAAHGSALAAATAKADELASAHPGLRFAPYALLWSAMPMPGDFWSAGNVECLPDLDQTLQQRQDAPPVGWEAIRSARAAATGCTLREIVTDEGE